MAGACGMAAACDIAIAKRGTLVASRQKAPKVKIVIGQGAPKDGAEG